jgi:hypothetical protein
MESQALELEFRFNADDDAQFLRVRPRILTSNKTGLAIRVDPNRMMSACTALSKPKPRTSA